jgi:sialidase-1
MASMERLGKVLLFSNPYNLSRADGKEEPGGSRDRKNVSVQLSRDAGKSWPVRKTIEAGWSGYSDLAVGKDETIYCLYEHGEPQETRFRPIALKLARFNLAWLTAP